MSGFCAYTWDISLYKEHIKSIFSTFIRVGKKAAHPYSTFASSTGTKEFSGVFGSMGEWLNQHIANV